MLAVLVFAQGLADGLEDSFLKNHKLPAAPYAFNDDYISPVYCDSASFQTRSQNLSHQVWAYNACYVFARFQANIPLTISNYWLPRHVKINPTSLLALNCMLNV